MGTPAPEEKERNLALYNDWKLLKKSKKKSYEIMSELMLKYKISGQRIYQIINREKNRK